MQVFWRSVYLTEKDNKYTNIVTEKAKTIYPLYILCMSGYNDAAVADAALIFVAAVADVDAVAVVNVAAVAVITVVEVINAAAVVNVAEAALIYVAAVAVVNVAAVVNSVAVVNVAAVAVIKVAELFTLVGFIKAILKTLLLKVELNLDL